MVYKICLLNNFSIAVRVQGTFVSKEDPLLLCLSYCVYPSVQNFFSTTNCKKIRISFKFKAEQVLV